MFVSCFRLLSLLCIFAVPGTACPENTFPNDREYGVSGLPVSLRVLGTRIKLVTDVKQEQLVSLLVLSRPDKKPVGLIKVILYGRHPGVYEYSHLLHVISFPEYQRKGYAGAALEVFLTLLNTIQSPRGERVFPESHAVFLIAYTAGSPFLERFYKKRGFIYSRAEESPSLSIPMLEMLEGGQKEAPVGNMMMILAIGDARYPLYQSLQRISA